MSYFLNFKAIHIPKEIMTMNIMTFKATIKKFLNEKSPSSALLKIYSTKETNKSFIYIHEFEAF